MSATPRILVDSKLIEDYQMSSALTGDTQVAATHFEGQPAYFSIGTADDVYFTRRDPASSSGWTQEKLGLKAKFITAAFESQMGTVLLCVEAENKAGSIHVRFRKQATEPWRKLSIPFTLGDQIKKIRLKNVRGRLYVMVIYQKTPEDETYPYRLTFAPFDFASTVFADSGTRIDGLNADFGVDSTGTAGLYVMFSPQIYWRAQGDPNKYPRQFYDSGNKGTYDGQNVTVWNAKSNDGGILPGFLADKVHAEKPGFNAGLEPLRLAYPLNDPSGSNELPPLTVIISSWKKVYDTHGTGTSDHQDFSFLQPVVPKEAPDYVALGCVGVKDMDPKLTDFLKETCAIHKDFAVPGKYYETRQNTSGVVDVYEKEEGYNGLGIWYTGKCGGSKKCVSVSKIVPQNPGTGISVGTFHARPGCENVTATDGAAFCPATEPKRRSILLFAPVGGTPKWRPASTATTALATSLAVVESSRGASDILCTLAGGQVCRLRGWSSGQKGAWEPMQTPPDVRMARVCAEANAHDDLNVFALTPEGHPFHLLLARQLINQAFVALEDIPSFLPLLGKGEKVTALEAATDAARNVSVIAVGHDGKGLASQFWVPDPRTGNWTMQPIHTGANAVLQEIRSFSVQLTATDENELPMADVTLRVWAEGPALVKINGKSQFLNKESAVEVEPLPDGRCRIMIPSDTIHAPVLHVHASFMAEKEYVSLSPNADIQIKLAKLGEPGALAGAQKNALHSNPAPLVTPGSADLSAKDLDEIGAYLSASMQLLPSFDYESDLKYLRWNREVQGKPAAKRAKPRRLSLLAPERALHFGLRIERGRARYLAYTPELAAQTGERLAKSATTTFAGTWGDAWNFIKQAGADLAHGFEVVISTIGKAVNAVVKFVIKGVTYIFNGTAHLVQEVFSMVEGVFSTIGVVYEDLVQWVGYLFDWDDILRTQKAIKRTLDFGFNMQKIGVQAIRTQADHFIETLKSTGDAAIDKIIASLSPDVTLGMVGGQTQLSPEHKSVNSHNTIFNSLMDNADTGTLRDMPVTTADVMTEALRRIEQELEAFVESSKITTMLNRMRQVPLNMESFLSASAALILELVKELADLALNVARDLIDAVLDILTVQINNLQAAFNARWDVPLLSALYKKLTHGDELSTASLLSLIMAVPITPLYKIVRGSTPFPDDQSLAQLEANFAAIEADAMRALSGSGAAAAPLTLPGESLQAVRWVFLIGQSVCQTVLVVVNPILALFPPPIYDASGSPVPGVSNKLEKYYNKITSFSLQTPLALLGSGTSFLSHVFAFPLGIFRADASPDTRTKSSLTLLLWRAKGIPPLLDFCSAATKGASLQNSGNYKVAMWTCLGTFQCLSAGVSLVGHELKNERPEPGVDWLLVDFFLQFFQNLPNALCFLRHDKIVLSSEGVSLPVYAGIKLLCDATSLGLSASRQVESYMRLH